MKFAALIITLNSVFSQGVFSEAPAYLYCSVKLMLSVNLSQDQLLGTIPLL